MGKKSTQIKIKLRIVSSDCGEACRCHKAHNQEAAWFECELSWRLMHLNTRSPAGGTILGYCGNFRGGAALEETGRPSHVAWQTQWHTRRGSFSNMWTSTWVVLWPPWDKCIYTNTQTHAHTGGFCLFVCCFFKEENVPMKERQSKAHFSEHWTFLWGKVRWVFWCPDHNLDVSRPQITKRETYWHTCVFSQWKFCQ